MSLNNHNSQKYSAAVAVVMLLLTAVPLYAQTPVTVTLEKADMGVDGWNNLIIKSQKARYVIGCDAKQPTCITPEPGEKYYLIDRHTSFTLPGATSPMTLAFLQDFYITYKNGENVGLIPIGGLKEGGYPGLYRLIKITLLGTGN